MSEQRMWPTPRTADATQGQHGLLGGLATINANGRAIRPSGADCSVPLSSMVLMEVAPTASTQLTLFAAASLVSLTPSQVAVAALPTSATSGPSSPASFASCNPDGSWRKTCQGYSQVTLDGSLEVFSETWPRAGMTRSGIAYQLRPSAPLTVVIGSGLLPTPNAVETVNPNKRYHSTTNASYPDGRKCQPTLSDVITRNMWPTPCAEDAKNVPYQKGDHGVRYPMLLGAVDPARMWPTPNSGIDHWNGSMQEWGGSGSWIRDHPELATGSLNPTWVEWLMGYPLGWTACAASATRSSRRSPNGSRTASARRKG
jgi:hypothetical protein